MALDINKMFADMVPSTPSDNVEGTARVNAMGTLGGMAAYLSPQRGRAMRQGLGGLLGEGVGMTPEEQIPKAMEGLNMNDPSSVMATARKLDAIGATRQAAQLRAVAMQNITQNRVAQREIQVEEQKAAAAVLRAETTAKYAGQNTQNDTDQVAVQAAQVAQRKVEYDQSVVEYNQGLKNPNIGQIKLGENTSASIAEYTKAVELALTPEERNAAINILRRKPEQNWEYRKDGTNKNDLGYQKWLLWPTGSELMRVMEKRDAKNEKGKQDRVSANGVVVKMGSMIKKLANKEISTGFFGLAFSKIPATDEFGFSGDLNVVLSNLGYKGLMDAKSSSVSGASGFGQLTEKELLLLQRLQEDLNIGLDRETLMERLQSVKAAFAASAARAKSDHTLADVLGHPQEDSAEDSAGNVQFADFNGDVYRSTDGENWVKQPKETK